MKWGYIFVFLLCPLPKDLHIKFEQQDGVKVEVVLQICPLW